MYIYIYIHTHTYIYMYVCVSMCVGFITIIRIKVFSFSDKRPGFSKTVELSV